MARRREFKNIADGLLNSFVSKKNLIHDEWTVVLLQKHMDQEQVVEVMIDLMQKKMIPSNVIFNEVIAVYSERFYEQIENRTMNLNFVTSVRIFFKEISSEEIQCQFVIVDDSGGNHISEKIIIIEE